MIYLILTFLLGNSSFCICPKQYALDHIKRVGCMLKEVMSGEVMTLSVINKINNKLKFIHGKKTFLTSTMRQLLYITCISSISFRLCLFCLLSQLNQKKKNQFKTNAFISVYSYIKWHICLIKSLKLSTGYSCLKDSSIALIQLSSSTLMINALIISVKFLKEFQKLILKLEEIFRNWNVFSAKPGPGKIALTWYNLVF